MKTTLTFEFNLPEDQDNLEMVTKYLDYYSVLTDLDSWLRSKVKYSDEPETVKATFQSVRTELLEFCNERGLDLWK